MHINSWSVSFRLTQSFFFFTTTVKDTAVCVCVHVCVCVYMCVCAGVDIQCNTSRKSSCKLSYLLDTLFNLKMKNVQKHENA